MCVAVVGGMERLQKHYIDEAKQLGIKLKVFNRHMPGIASKIRNVDAIVIFTNKVSHNAKKEAVNEAKTMNIPLHMYHSCGICTLRDCLDCLIRKEI